MRGHTHNALCMLCCTLTAPAELGRSGSDVLLHCDRRSCATNGLPMLPGKSTGANNWTHLQITLNKLQFAVGAFINLYGALLAGSA